MEAGEVLTLGANRGKLGQRRRMPENDFLTVLEAAQYVKISTRTVYRMVESGELIGHRVGTGANAPIRIQRSDLLAWLTKPKRLKKRKRAKKKS